MLLRSYAGRPTPLYTAKRLTEHVGGARILLKREDLAHTGSHKINNALGQALLAKRMGRTRVIAETGAGQHGVATATACALLGLECEVYMGEVDVKRQRLNCFRMGLLGAKVNVVTSGTRTLKDAINEALRDYAATSDHTHYLIGSVVGPHPYPTIVRDLQSVIGREARAQALDELGRLPDALVACVGGGSNVDRPLPPVRRRPGSQDVRGGGGRRGRRDREALRERRRRGGGRAPRGEDTRAPGPDGQISETHSVAAGLDYSAVGPEHAHLDPSRGAPSTRRSTTRTRSPRSTCSPSWRASSQRWRALTPSPSPSRLARTCPRIRR